MASRSFYLNIDDGFLATSNFSSNKDIWKKTYNGLDIYYAINNRDIKVGINNTNPTKTLDVTGDIQFSGNLYKNNELINKPIPLNAQFHIINETPKLNKNENKPINNEPLIFAELGTEIEELTVAEALEKMKLGNIPALMFRNKKHKGLNMIYRRQDDLIGWVDPRGNRNSAKI